MKTINIIMTSIAITLLATTSSAAFADAPTGVVQIGGLFPITGDLASIGAHMELASEKAVDDFNQYLAESGASWSLEWVSEDTATSPVIAFEKIQSLYSKGINIVVGPATSSATTQVKGYADTNGMLIFSPSSTAPSLAIADDNVFRLVPSDFNQGTALGKLMNAAGIEMVVPIWRGEAYGDGLRDAAVNNFQDRGGSAHDEGVRYNPEASEYSLEVSTLADQVQDAIDEYGADKVAVLAISFDEVESILQTASQYSALSEVRWFASEATAGKATILEDRISSEFAHDTQLTAVQFKLVPGEKANDLRQYLIDELGGEGTSFVYPSYDAVQVAAMSIMAANSTDIDDIKAVLYDVASSYEGVMSSTALDSSGDLALANYQVWEVVDNEWKETNVYGIEQDIIAAAEQPSEDVDIGVIYPLTGDLAERGTHRLAGAELGASDFNTYLATLGIDWRLVLHPEDNETKATTSLDKAQLLNSKGIKFIIGPAGSSNVLAVKSYADTNDMVVVSCCSTSPTLSIINDNIFRLAPDDSLQGLALARLLEHEGIESVVPIWRNDDYANNLVGLVRENFESRGMIDEGIPYDPNLVDHSASVSLLADKVAELVTQHGTTDKVAVLIVSYDEILSIVQSASDYPILSQVRWFAGESIAKADYILADRISGEFVNDVGLTAFQIFENRGTQYEHVTNHIIGEFGVSPATYVYQSYDAAWLLGLSILASGSADPMVVKEHLPDIAANYKGALASTKLNAAGDLQPLDLAIWQVENGAWTEKGKYGSEKHIIIPPTQVDGDVTIGAVYPLTGDLAARGVHRLAASELAAEDFNKYLRTLGYEWSLILDDEDSATNPEITREKVQTLNAKGVNLIIGIPSSSNVRTVQQYVNTNDMLVLSCCSTSPALAIAGDNVFRIAPDDSTQGRALAQLMDHEGIEAMISIWRNDDYGQGLADNTHENFEALGGVVEPGIAYDPNLPTVSSDVDLLAGKVTDLVSEYGAEKVAVLMVGYDESVNIVQGASSYDILSDVRWFGAETYVNVQYFAEDPIANEFINSVDFTAMFVLPNEGAALESVKEHIRNEFGTEPASYVAQAYDAAWLIGLSILESGTSDTDAIKAALPMVASTYSGAMLSADLNEVGDLQPQDLQIWHVVDSEWVNVGIYKSSSNTVELD